MIARVVRDHEVVGLSPTTSTKMQNQNTRDKLHLSCFLIHLIALHQTFLLSTAQPIVPRLNVNYTDKFTTKLVNLRDTWWKFENFQQKKRR